jgi:8-oxo-dGTP diphosphatase
MKEATVRVGVGVFVIKDGQFLMIKRQGSHGAGSWCVPGGHQEFGESFEDTARREIREETGLEIQNIRFGAVTNDYFKDEGKHYVSIWMLSDYAGGHEKIMEPDKFTDMGWYTFETLPEGLFLPWKQFLASEFFERVKLEVEASNDR